MNDLNFKKWLLGSIPTAALVVLGYFFKEPILKFIEIEITVPIYVFPLISIGTLAILFFIRWCLVFRNRHLKFMRSIIEPGVDFGVINGHSPVTAIEWSWLNPAVVIAQTRDGKIIRVHHSRIGLFM